MASWIPDAAFANSSRATTVVRRTVRFAAVRLVSVEHSTEVDEWIAQRRVECVLGATRTDAEGKLLVRGLPHGEYEWSCGVASGRVRVPPRALAREKLAVRF